MPEVLRLRPQSTKKKLEGAQCLEVRAEISDQLVKQNFSQHFHEQAKFETKKVAGKIGAKNSNTIACRGSTKNQRQV